MIFTAKNAFTLQWTLTDSSGVSVNTAVNLTATLYSGRLLSDPDDVPGLSVPPIQNVTLTYVPSSQGVYQAAIPGTLDPTQQQLAAGFVLVIDEPVLGYHNEAAATVIPESIDLTTLDAVKAELNIPQSNHNPDNELQGYITAWSAAVLNQTGIKSFAQPTLVTEIRDGNGNAQMFTRMRPIINVVSVSISGKAVAQAGAFPSAGYYISDDLKSIKLRTAQLSRISFNYYPNYGLPTQGFQRGQGNVQLVYWAGYVNVPLDLEIASRKMVAIYYGRKQTRDQASIGIAAGGTTATTRFRDWDVPPEICKVVDYYSRTAII